MKKSLVAGCALVVGIACFALTQRQGNAQADNAGRAGARDAQAGRFNAQNVGQQFIKDQIQCNLMEVQISQLVAQKAQNEQIKEFAQMIAKDHQKANEQLKELAREKNIQVSEQLEDWRQATLDHVKQIQGPDLERKYIFHQVGGHHTAILEQRFAAAQAQDQDIRQLAARMVPKLQDHLRQAERIAQQYAGIAGEPTGPTERRERLPQE
jgi:putative membrane protein